MNFKLTNQKVIASIGFGLLIALVNFTRQIFQGVNAEPLNYFNIILVWPISAIIIYIIWSLFEKNKKRKK